MALILTLTLTLSQEAVAPCDQVQLGSTPVDRLLGALLTMALLTTAMLTVAMPY